MAGTSLLTHRIGVGGPGYKLHIRRYAGPASYATSGFAADLATDLGITKANIAAVQVHSSKGYRGHWDSTTDKVLVYTSGDTETTATTNLSAVNFDLWVIEQL